MFVLAFGIVVSFLVGVLAGLLWSPLQWPVFAVLMLCWMGLAVDAMRRQRSGEDIASLASSRKWLNEELPEEFRFINRDTTLAQIAQKIGPPTRIRGEGEIRAFQYDLPYNSAVLIFPEPPFESNSSVRGAKFYRNKNDILIFP